MSDRIRCYAQVTRVCFDGQDLAEWWDDNTYRKDEDAIVCDACYVEVMRASPSGRALTHEIEPTLRRMRAWRVNAA